MDINKVAVQLVVLAAVGLDFYLEIHGKPVPVTIGIVVGYFLQHSLGVSKTDDKPSSIPPGGNR